ncbi:MAG TPA: hypothetical protein PLL26_05340 [Candidatus Dojkabacteria bacterium]|nr:hypothetical protein [Candidatus Dojkabacteria bacterium]
MKIEQLNSFFRTIFKQLIDDGYKKRHICALTLGAQSEPQFENFLNGKDFGVKPLARIADAFQYELQVVVVPKNDKEAQKVINTLNNNNLASCKVNLTQALNNTAKVKEASIIKSSAIDESINLLLQEID